MKFRNSYKKENVHLKVLDMKRVYLILSIVFALLTFIGAGYVLYHHGDVNAGYACIPMIAAITCISIYRMEKKE